MKFLLVAGFADSLLGFRAPLIHALQKKGIDVHLAAPGLPANSPTRKKLEANGLTVHEIYLHRTGTNPISDINTLISIYSLIRKLNPDFFMGYTIKPVIYGSIAAWIAKVPRRYALITGLGHAFQENDKEVSRIESLVQKLYSFSLSNTQKIFFQNPDDENLFRRRNIINSQSKTCVVNGSGIDIKNFSFTPQTNKNNVRFLLIARLLAAKGIRIYAEAARKIKALHPEVSFSLVGWIDENPDSISQIELDEWISEGTIQYLGKMSDVRPAIINCNVFVLPTYYREGTPRTVLEAMAIGRAVITTDAPGCRETVVNEDNGFLIPVKSVDALIVAMKRFIDEPYLATRMGNRSRQIAEEKYDVHKVNAVMLQEMGIY